jgi:hypothetical protein
MWFGPHQQTQSHTGNRPQYRVRITYEVCRLSLVKFGMEAEGRAARDGVPCLASLVDDPEDPVEGAT